MNKEISRRLRMSWTAFGRLSNELKSELPNKLKRKLYEQCILPVLTYKKTQRAQERRMLNEQRMDPGRNRNNGGDAKNCRVQVEMGRKCLSQYRRQMVEGNIGVDTEIG